MSGLHVICEVFFLKMTNFGHSKDAEAVWEWGHGHGHVTIPDLTSHGFSPGQGRLYPSKFD
jgi:hypothetical protein